MWIESLNIHRFGIFNDFPLENLSKGLTLFYGENESGKSTLMAFIRQILFGFPDKRSNKRQYPPLSGGRYGGSITIRSTDDVEFRIIRHEGPRGGTITVYRNDVIGGEDQLRKLLNPSQEDLFYNVFAFGQDELQELQSISNENIDAHLYGAAAGVRPKNIINAATILENRAGEIFKHRGRVTEINQILNELKIVEQNLRDSQKMLTEYGDRYNDLESTEEEKAGLDATLEKLKRKQGELNLLLSTINDWVEFNAASQELEELPAVDKFPDDGESRLITVTKDKENAERAFERLNDRNTQLEKEYYDISPDERIIEVEQEIRSLYQRNPVYTNALEDLTEVKSESAAYATQLTGHYKKIGRGWNRERIEQADVSMQNKAMIMEFDEKFDFLNRAQEITKNNLERLQKTRDAQNEHYEVVKHNLELLKNAYADRTLPGLLPKLPALIVAILGTATGILLYLYISDTAALIDGIIASVLALGYVGVRHFLDKRLYDIRNEQKRNEMNNEERDRDRLNKEYEAMAAEVTNNENKLETLQEDWQKLLAQFGLSVHIQHATALDIFNEIDSAKLKIVEYDKLCGRISRMEGTIEDFERALHNLTERLEIEESSDVSPADMAERLHKKLVEESKLQSEKKSIEKNLQDLDLELKQAGKEVKHAEQAIDELLQQAGASSVEDFREKLQIWNRKKALTEQKNQAELRLKTATGSDERYAWLIERLPKTDRGVALNNEIESTEVEIKELSDQKEELVKKIAVFKRDIADMEKSTAMSDLLAEREVLRTRLKHKAEQWAVYAAAGALLRQARNEYEKNRQPVILKEADKHFNAITGGRYAGIVKPLDGSPLFVTDTFGSIPKSDRQFSRGTSEELYYAIRLGFITGLGERGEPLPVIMDDIFVNMDDKRQPAAIRALKPLTETNQVLVFTCHSKIAELIKQEFPDTPINKLHDGSLA